MRLANTANPLLKFSPQSPQNIMGGFASMLSKIRLAVRWAYNCGAL